MNHGGINIFSARHPEMGNSHRITPLVNFYRSSAPFQKQSDAAGPVARGKVDIQKSMFIQAMPPSTVVLRDTIRWSQHITTMTWVSVSMVRYIEKMMLPIRQSQQRRLRPAHPEMLTVSSAGRLSAAVLYSHESHGTKCRGRWCAAVSSCAGS